MLNVACVSPPADEAGAAKKPGRRPIEADLPFNASNSEVGVSGIVSLPCGWLLTSACSRQKRRAQNRAAQRAFRERKERYVKELEDRIQELEQQVNVAQDQSTVTQLRQENDQLRALVERLAEENRALQNAKFTFDLPMSTVRTPPQDTQLMTTDLLSRSASLPALSSKSQPAVYSAATTAAAAGITSPQQLRTPPEVSLDKLSVTHSPFRGLFSRQIRTLFLRWASSFNRLLSFLAAHLSADVLHTILVLLPARASPAALPPAWRLSIGHFGSLPSTHPGPLSAPQIACSRGTRISGDILPSRSCSGIPPLSLASMLANDRATHAVASSASTETALTQLLVNADGPLKRKSQSVAERLPTKVNRKYGTMCTSMPVPPVHAAPAPQPWMWPVGGWCGGDAARFTV